MLQLNINTDASVIFTNKLEKMHKSALPVAIRTALNSAAFDMKKKTLLNSASAAFENRSSNFFKAFSKVEPATGFDVNGMKATVGFVERGLKGDNNYAVKDLKQQEEGGAIGGKSLIPLNSARSGNSKSRLVKSANKLTSIKDVINARNQTGKTKGEKFVNAVLKAGAGGFVLGSDVRGENILWRVVDIKSNIKQKKFKPKLIPLYDYSAGRKIKVDKTGFAQKAALSSAQRIEHFYIEAAQKQFEKHLKK